MLAVNVLALIFLLNLGRKTYVFTPRVKRVSPIGFCHHFKMILFCDDLFGTVM